MSDELSRRGKDPTAECERLPAAPLSYEAPIDQLKRNPSANVLGMTLAFGTGLCLSGGGVLLLGVPVAIAMNGNTPRIRAAVVYFLGFIIFAGLTGRLIRRPGWKIASRWFASGALLGVGLGCLVEGICFSVSYNKALS